MTTTDDCNSEMLNVVLDTSCIVYDPNCIENIEKANIIIHINVLNELDGLKRYPDEPGRNARIFIKRLDKYFDSSESLSHVLPNGSTLTIGTFDAVNPLEKADSALVQCALLLSKSGPTQIMTRDINLRMRARACGIKAVSYEKSTEQNSELFSGMCSLRNPELGKRLQTNSLPISEYEELSDLYPHECILFTDQDRNGVALGRRVGNQVQLIKEQKLWSINTRNKEQACAADLLLDPSIPLVTLIGNAGTGKTLLTLAAALEATVNRNAFSRIIVYRPMQPVGQEMGFLPGNLEEKLDPWMSAIKDNLDFITHAKCKRSQDKGKQGWREKLGQYADLIHLEAVTYIRGRSIPNAYIIIDESQNTTREQIKTILTRVGAGSKIVMTGDIYQIDGQNIDAINNGLTYTAEAFKSSELAGHITLTKGERSKLATEASLIL